MFKVCSSKECETSRSEQLFGKSSRNKDGLSSICKVCKSRIDKAYRSKPNIALKRQAERKSDKYKAYQAEYRARPENITREQNRDTSSYEASYRKSDKGKENQVRFLKDNPGYAKKLRDTPIQKARKKAYDAINKDAIKAYRGSPTGKAMIRASDHKRRAQVMATEDGTVTAQSLLTLKESQKGLCYHCSCVLDFEGKGTVHLDHYIPLSRGGTHTILNVVWSCPTCNLIKHAKLL